ncbi:GNAT family N-acetyltransferase [Candidatus Kaiserbacteria bacterium]|nr:GNAT family N-acetyltransferase [Candidatus Kaiserbacteria bacterium]
MSADCELVVPSVEYRDSFLEAAKEYKAEGSVRFDFELAERDFPQFIKELNEHSLGLHMPEGYVPETMYWLIDGGEYIGQINIRHELNEHLRQIGGHIGYDIRSSKRNKGYGTAQLQLMLPKAKEMGLTRVLITCDVTNIGSRKIIESAGGVLENQAPNPDTGIDKLRFWVSLG